MTAATIVTASWEAIGTTALVQVAEERDLDLAIGILTDELARIDRAASSFRGDSELARVLGAGGRPVAVGDGLREAVLVALRSAELTGGIVDPTLGQGCDWRAVEVGDWHIRVPAGAALDLGATGKALAADRAASAIGLLTDNAGVLVSLGGDIATSGQPPAGGWLIHVTDDHRADHAANGQTVTIQGGALATSGTTVRSGPGGHHIIDPRTGRCAETPWRTATVTAATCVDANTAATAAIVLGDDAPQWLIEHGFAARLVDHAGGVLGIGGWPDCSERV